MQANTLLTFLGIMILVTGSPGCKKDKGSEPGLPPLTADGKNTFGCKVNGAVFVPKRKLFGSRVTCAYQKLYPGSHGFVFVVGGELTPLNSCNGSNVSIYVDSISLQTGSQYTLKARPPGKHRGSYRTTENCGTTSRRYVTNEYVTGEVTITHFNDSFGIVAGTFWFDAVDEFGDTVHITEGRFDMEYID
jgi:hypothetical protein